MKLIEEVSLWSEGASAKASILNAYAVSVIFDKSATFWYGMYAKTEDGNVGSLLAQGNIQMNKEEYDLWESDDIAWNFIANKLNLVITGDFVAPEVQPTLEEATVVE